jgi:hypothetical protein
VDSLTLRKEIRDAQLGFRLAFETIDGDDDPAYQVVRLIPEFPEVRANIEAKTTIVWDLPQLCQSIQKPGGYHVLNCECGIGDHSGLRGLAFVAHPDDETVVWEIDLPDHRTALHERWRDQTGFLRMHFRRADYESDIRAMLAAVLSAGSPELPVEEYAPDNHHGEAYEWLQSRAAANDWSRQQIFPPGTRLEFQPGQDSHSHVLRDGMPLRGYVPRLITRWSVAYAYNCWTRLFWKDGAFQIDDPVACDAAGRQFVARLQVSYAEGATAPDVTITYCPDLTLAI